ncbi:beige/BEACH domain-containing protein [Ditylenchus destructor]|uniref:Beige/BEACH domain-containing protein n=1 Tax=Ditylenchus destructor TaxID=166010 RepID=A0AAD4NIZ3_9BILA|nr:beige/BEACH domain-containing protein [Ditylenchus destructor]
MDEGTTRDIGIKCALLGDGEQSVAIGDTFHNISVITLPAEELRISNLIYTLNSSRCHLPATNLIDHNEYSNALSSTECLSSPSMVMKQICARFQLSFMLTKNSALLSFDWRPQQYIAHLLPIICIVQVDEDDFKIIYHSRTDLETLHLYSLYSHHNFSVHEQTFNLLALQLVQLFECFASRSMYPIFSPHHILADKHFWLYIDLGTFLRANNFPQLLHETATRWCKGELSNLDYLLKINEFAGRVRDDPSRHPIVPWVVDFSSEDGGFRALDQTKYRLTKGDDQLNEQFSNQQTAYHVPEFLSDICYMAYKARNESKDDLCKYVRTAWVPEEYPSTVSRLYAWTPDECIPEFYEDPNIFISRHADMCDLGLPQWTATPEAFITWHRKKLESYEVSSKLHRWIDLCFGYLLSGQDAVDALNDRAPAEVHESIISVGVTIIELALAEYCRDFSKDVSFDERKLRAKALLNNKVQKLARNMRSALYSLLDFDKTSETSIKSDQFSNLFKTYFAFSPNIILAHEYLVDYHSLDQQIDCLTNSIGKSFGAESALRQCRTHQLNIMLQCFEIEELNNLWLNIFIDMLHCRHSGTLVCRKLFSKSAEFSTPTKMAKTFIPVMKKLFESGTPDSVQLFDRRFLLQICIRLGSATFFAEFLPLVVEAVLLPTNSINEVAKESILWLSKRYGPIVTAKHITLSLLRLLAICYTDASPPLEFDEATLEVKVDGDGACACINDCLVQIATIYGPAFVTLQYMPFCADIIEQAIRRLTIPLESAITAAVVTLQIVCDCLTNKQIMDNLQDVIVDKILFPAVRLFSSANVTFASEHNRKLFAYKAIRSLSSVGARIGSENVQRYMAGLIQLISTFTPSFARALLNGFSSICGKQFIVSSLPNATLIGKIAANPRYTDKNMRSPSVPISSPSLGRISPNLNPWSSSPIVASSPLSASFQSGNRLSTFIIGDSPMDENEVAISPSPESLSSLNSSKQPSDDNCYHMTESWIDHLRSVLSSTSDNISFNQIQIANYQGHTAAIRKILVLDNENSFITGSHDKTIKLWSIKSTEEYSTAQWTYKNHTKSIQDFVLLPSNGLVASVASADPVLHIWDPFRGSPLRQLEWTMSSSGNTECGIIGLANLGNHLVGAATNAETIVRMVDARMGKWASHLCTSPILSGCYVKAMSASPDQNKLAIALNNGCNSIIDVRTGKIISYYALQHSDIIQICWIGHDMFASVHAEHGTMIWSHSPKIRVERRLPEIANFLTPVGPLLATGGQFITAQSNAYRLKLYDDDKCTEVKLRAEFISGVVTSLTALEKNKAFFVGSSTGMIRLAS